MRARGGSALLALAAASLPAAAQLAYVESSVGLEEPTWEGGDSELEMADVDLDGHVDLLSTGDHGNPNVNATEQGIMIWFGDGLGSFSYAHAGNLGYGGIAAGDVNGDGSVDVAYGIHHDYGTSDLGDQKLEVALGDGSGLAWTPWDDGLARQGQSWGMFATDLGDVDGDGRLDVGATGFGASDGMHIYLNAGDGSWRRSFGFLGGNSRHVFRFGDVDGDGHLDVATAKEEGTVWLGDGEGFFTRADGDLPPPGGLGLYDGPSLGDVDGDGQDDLAACDSAGDPHVYLWRGAMHWQEFSAGLPPLGGCRYTELHDMDGDGSIDLTTFGSREVRVFGRDPTGSSWIELARFTVPDSPGTARAFRTGGDVDHNGRADIALLSERRVGLFDSRNQLRVYREATPPGPLSVRVVAPGRHRTLLAGAVRFVRWAASVPPGDIGRVTIELSVDGPDGPWDTLAADLPNSGLWQWRVPPHPSSDGYLRVTLRSASGEVSAVGPGPFTIARRPDPIALRWEGRSRVSWTDALSRPRFHLYRGDWSHFLATGEYTQDPAVVPDAARFCDLTSPALDDPFVPAAGRLVFYLATAYRLMEDGQQPGVPVAMAEGALGQDSAARMRPNRHRCGP